MTAPMPQHGVNAVEEDRYVAFVDDIVTPLLTVKRNLLLAGLFPGCSKGCLLCAVFTCWLSFVEIRYPKPDG